MSDLFDRVVLPVADQDDAAATCEALGDRAIGSVVAVHVVEKAGGAPDKASVEQRKERAAEIFDAVADRLPDAVALETEITYGTDVAEAIFAVADDVDATAIVITPRGGSRWLRLLTGDVALSLVTETDRPVVVLPDGGRGVDREGDLADDGGSGSDSSRTGDAGDELGRTGDEHGRTGDELGRTEDGRETPDEGGSR